MEVIPQKNSRILMKKILISTIAMAGLLMADQNTTTKALQTAFLAGFTSQQSTLEAKQRLDAYYAEKIAPSQAAMNGLAFGVAVLPTLLDDTKIQGNMSSETLVKGCEFLVSHASQHEAMSAKDKSEMVDGCVIGYSSYLVNEGKLDLYKISEKLN
jgi:hypothetical protein